MGCFACSVIKVCAVAMFVLVKIESGRTAFKLIEDISQTDNRLFSTEEVIADLNFWVFRSIFHLVTATSVDESQAKFSVICDH